MSYEHGLCNRCGNFREAKAKETGTVFQFCDLFKQSIPRPIVSCTGYDSSDVPTCFYTDAWQIRDDKFFDKLGRHRFYEDGKVKTGGYNPAELDDDIKNLTDSNSWFKNFINFILRKSKKEN